MFPFQLWIDLPIGTRIKIATHFGVKKHGSTHVVDNQIADDGYKVKELSEALSLKALQAFHETSIDNYMALWEAMIGKITGKPVDIPMTGIAIDIAKPKRKKK